MALDIIVADPLPLQKDRHGVVRVGGTRVTLDTVIGAYLDGANVEEIVQDYDALNLADVHAVISYYLNHREEVEAYLRQRQEEAERIRQENERRFPMQGIRARLLARKQHFLRESPR